MLGVDLQGIPSQQKLGSAKYIPRKEQNVFHSKARLEKQLSIFLILTFIVKSLWRKQKKEGGT